MSVKFLPLPSDAVWVSLPCCQLWWEESSVSCAVFTCACPFPALTVPSPPFAARKTKKKIKGLQQGGAAGAREAAEAAGSKSIVPASLPQLTPTLVSLLEVIEPEVLYSGYDSSLPDSSWRILSTLNMLGGRQVVAAVKWAKAIPGEARAQGVLPAGFLWAQMCLSALKAGHVSSWWYWGFFMAQVLWSRKVKKIRDANIYLLQTRLIYLNTLTIEC